MLLPGRASLNWLFKKLYGHSSGEEEQRSMRSKLSKSARILVLGGLFCAYQVSGFSQQAPAADNTKSNDRASQATADQQSNAPSDRELTQSVRKAIMKDKSLSTYAH